MAHQKHQSARRHNGFTVRAGDDWSRFARRSTVAAPSMNPMEPRQLKIAADGLIPGAEATQTLLHRTLEQAERIRIGETIRLGWSWFVVAEDGTGGLRVRSPRPLVDPFSLIDDCSYGLNVVTRQKFVVESYDIDPVECHCRQNAIVVRDFDKCHEHFINRTDEPDEVRSGWFFGAGDSTLDVDAPDSFEVVSLWTMACRFPDAVPFLLLPVNWQVAFQDSGPVVLRDFEPQPARPGSYCAKLGASKTPD